MQSIKCTKLPFHIIYHFSHIIFMTQMFDNNNNKHFCTCSTNTLGDSLLYI